LNVYSGLAGFYFVRDAHDTGKEGIGLAGEPVNLPAGTYEVALAIQDRFFKNNGEFLFPAFPGDPGYKAFITEREVTLNSSQFPHCASQDGTMCGPTALAEFFGDHMLVNGKIWPRMDVKPRHYRLRLLNGCDSRFLQLQFCTAGTGTANIDCDSGNLIPFYVIGGDQGLAPKATKVNETLLMETGSRYDIIFDFTGLANKRVIMKNIGGDMPFGGEIGGDFVFSFTNRIMAFDVGDEDVFQRDNFNLAALDRELSIIAAAQTLLGEPDYIRKVALFEGTDEFSRYVCMCQSGCTKSACLLHCIALAHFARQTPTLLGTVMPAETWQGRIINWPKKSVYKEANLTGPMQGTMTWHEPITENPQLNSVEVWEIWNFSPDAHPIHLHLVKFEVLGRQIINDTLVRLVPQKTVQHNDAVGNGSSVVLPPTGPYVTGDASPGPAYVENHYKDIVTALPGQITSIKMKFTKFGHYVWHCHILSHEDHEMMRVMFVGGNPSGTSGRNLRGNAENEYDA
jgi:FtsP/CotA-like multicopper oxidase with cupredoxin domain